MIPRLDIERSGEEQAAWDKGLTVEEGREGLRKNSFISKRLNDPKLLEVLRPSVADLYSRVIFPVTFLLFNLFYWGFFLLFRDQPRLAGS